MFLPFKDKLRYSALLNHSKHGRKVSAYQSFWTSNNFLPIHRKGREIESAEKLTWKNEKQINHQNKPKSQNKLKKKNALQWPFGVFISGKLKHCIRNHACIFRQRKLRRITVLWETSWHEFHIEQCETPYFHFLLNSLLDKMDACFFNYGINIWQTAISETNKKQNKSIWPHVSNTGCTNNFSK